jgi:hypothetical protein
LRYHSFFVIPYFLWLLIASSLNGYILLNNWQNLFFFTKSRLLLSVRDWSRYNFLKFANSFAQLRFQKKRKLDTRIYT